MARPSLSLVDTSTDQSHPIHTAQERAKAITKKLVTAWSRIQPINVVLCVPPADELGEGRASVAFMAISLWLAATTPMLCLQAPILDPSSPQAIEAGSHRLPGTVLLGEISPACSRAVEPLQAVGDLAMILRRAATHYEKRAINYRAMETITSIAR